MKNNNNFIRITCYRARVSIRFRAFYQVLNIFLILFVASKVSKHTDRSNCEQSHAFVSPKCDKGNCVSERFTILSLSNGSCVCFCSSIDLCEGLLNLNVYYREHPPLFLLRWSFHSNGGRIGFWLSL